MSQNERARAGARARGEEKKGEGEMRRKGDFIHKTSFTFCSELMLSVRASNFQQDKGKLWLK